jgi:hypothetical protein
MAVRTEQIWVPHICPAVGQTRETTAAQALIVRSISGLTSANDSFALVNELTCFHRPLGTVKKSYCPTPTKDRTTQTYPPGWT